ncbi:hypothetical protein PINS_up010349 [Pythium insidiosum]|nr:hypothetical protein PINS_up010349 [Pythium insidiosum]
MAPTPTPLHTTATAAADAFRANETHSHSQSHSHSLMNKQQTQTQSQSQAKSTQTSPHAVVVDHFLRLFDGLQSRFTQPGQDQFDAVGKPRLVQTLLAQMQRDEPIHLVLPAFPFKSPNRGVKVLGALPDRGEEIALARLDAFCASIESVYPRGCHVTIFSDGRVFNDLLGVPLSDLQAYKAELRAMVRDAGLTHIRFDGLERHTETQDPIREVLDRFGVGELDMDALIKSDDGLLNTYRAFRKFLKKDLAHKWAEMSNTQASKQMGDIAKRMMHRNVGFSRLVDHVYPSAVRISIHLYDNAGPKFGVYLLPHDADSPNVPRTPWHSVVCENLDGTVVGVDLDSVDRDLYELVEKRGRAWGFRERAKGAATPSATSASAGATAGVSAALSAMTIKAEQTTKNTTNAIDAIDLSVDELKKQWDDLDVDFVEEPFLLIIQARNTQQPPSMTRVPVASLRALACKYGVVSLRGFKQDDDLVQVAERVGPVLEWPFGKVFEIKSVADTALTGQTREAMPMHYDGLFKKKHPDSTELGDVWLYQLFHCVEAYPSQEGDNSNGRTLFTHTRRLLADLTEAQRERLRKATLVYYSGILGNDHLVHVSPVIIPHPVTGEEIVRFHEPWGAERTKMFPVTVTSQGVDAAKVVSGEVVDAEADWVCKLLVEKLYDPKYCYAHAWSKGEFLFADNFALIHARTAMKADGRHVRRIHIN